MKHVPLRINYLRKFMLSNQLHTHTHSLSVYILNKRHNLNSIRLSLQFSGDKLNTEQDKI